MSSNDDKQDEVKANRDALRDQERRVDASVSADVRNTPVQSGADRANTASQDQVRADHDALADQARRVEASVPANGDAATDPNAAATQDRVKADHDRMQESARRVEASVPADVRDTPIKRADNDRH
jgi:hypothetical protein